MWSFPKVIKICQDPSKMLFIGILIILISISGEPQTEELLLVVVTKFKDAGKRDKLLAAKERYLVKRFFKYFPDIPFEADYSWAGTFGETKDGLPYFGKPDPKRKEHYVLGFGGNGITFSILGMKSILFSLEGRRHADLEYYKFNR